MPEGLGQRWPQAEERPWRFDTPPGIHTDFESAEWCEREDQHRAGNLTSSSIEEARRLGELLKRDGAPHLPPFTPASSRAWRLTRARLLLGALPMVREWQADGGAFLSTVVSHRWFYPVGQLHLAKPLQMRGMLLRELERGGLRTSAAQFVGRFEGALTIHRETGQLGYALHLHGVGNAAMRQACAALPDHGGFAKTDEVAQPVRSPQVKVGEESSALGYALKSFWKQRDSGGHIGPGGTRLFRGFLADDYLTEALLWLSRWRPGELTVVIGTYRLRPMLRPEWYLKHAPQNWAR